jgi:hypothetical protein
MLNQVKFIGRIAMIFGGQFFSFMDVMIEGDSVLVRVDLEEITCGFKDKDWVMVEGKLRNVEGVYSLHVLAKSIKKLDEWEARLFA